MRISDWSSDVCSSDLPTPSCCVAAWLIPCLQRFTAIAIEPKPSKAGAQASIGQCLARHRCRQDAVRRASRSIHRAPLPKKLGRSSTSKSEEQTSELQSLMRTSYAFFYLKKKIQSTTP